MLSFAVCLIQNAKSYSGKSSILALFTAVKRMLAFCTDRTDTCPVGHCGCRISSSNSSDLPLMQLYQAERRMSSQTQCTHSWTLSTCQRLVRPSCKLALTRLTFPVAMAPPAPWICKACKNDLQTRRQRLQVEQLLGRDDIVGLCNETSCYAVRGWCSQHSDLRLSRT